MRLWLEEMGADDFRVCSAVEWVVVYELETWQVATWEWASPFQPESGCQDLGGPGLLIHRTGRFVSLLEASFSGSCRLSFQQLRELRALLGLGGGLHLPGLAHSYYCDAHLPGAP